MNNVKKIAILLLVVAVMTGFTQAATHESKPDATLRLSGGSFALGIGFRWGSGTLYLQGQRLSGQGERPIDRQSRHDRRFSVGEVFNLKHLQDFNGHYNVGAAGHPRCDYRQRESWHPYDKSGRCDSPPCRHTNGS